MAKKAERAAWKVASGRHLTVNGRRLKPGAAVRHLSEEDGVALASRGRVVRRALPQEPDQDE